MDANAAFAFSARLSSGKFARTTVHTERGNSGCGSHNVCWHALPHKNGSKRVRHRFGYHFGILPFHTEEEKEEDIQGYICKPDFTVASYLWKIPPPSKGASIPPIQVSPRETWAEFHENKRTYCFTRNSLCDHRLERSTYREAFWLCRQVTACKIISAVLIGRHFKKWPFLCYRR